MPFFAQSKWLQNASRFWIWILLTIPTTIAAFIIYGFWQRRERRLTSLISSKDDLELSLLPQSPSMALEQTA
jgi:ABC-type phosphate transport system permease subunit